MEKIMSKNTAINNAATGERELNEAELNHISGGKGDRTVKYMEYKLNDTLISSVMPSSLA